MMIQDSDLIAPCGMNCGICSAYLACSENIPQRRGKITHCTGCRIRQKKCVYIKSHCPRLREGSVQFCFECEDFPCTRLETLDKRYRTRYGMSMIENLHELKEVGIDAFLASQREKYRCPRCGGMICIHNGKCYRCDTIL
jgi:hypothetical protein